ncbi:MAG: hypothetical protein IKR69_01580 [Bacteroidales bacterium]|nr:hypothetical protein [Bacteroidales bacterium]
MKKIYQTPKQRVRDLLFDASIMASVVGIQSSSGEDLYDPEVIDPWS